MPSLSPIQSLPELKYEKLFTWIHLEKAALIYTHNSASVFSKVLF